ncbi:MAG: hypothetical protein Q8Q81_07785 [Oxalobacteraceae bacterium]|nr:hypothetical protein [Oxalobacteraceae bacterium]
MKSAIINGMLRCSLIGPTSGARLPAAGLATKNTKDTKNHCLHLSQAIAAVESGGVLSAILKGKGAAFFIEFERRAGFAEPVTANGRKPRAFRNPVKALDWANALSAQHFCEQCRARLEVIFQDAPRVEDRTLFRPGFCSVKNPCR